MCKAVKINFISSKELDRSADLLDLSTCFQEATAIPGISKYHCIEPQEGGQVRFRIYSSQLHYVELGDPHKSDSNSESDNGTTSDLSELEGRDEDYNFDSNDEEITTSEGDHADDTDEEEDNSGDDRISDHESAGGNNDTLSAAILKVQQCIPRDLQPLFDVSKPFTLHHLQYRADAIAKGVLSFHGHSIISDTDLEALLGESSV